MKNKKVTNRQCTLKLNKSISPIEGTFLVSIKGGLFPNCSVAQCKRLNDHDIKI